MIILVYLDLEKLQRWRFQVRLSGHSNTARWKKCDRGFFNVHKGVRFILVIVYEALVLVNR